MRDVLIIGDGPGGLSAALFLAKNDLDVAVYGADDTAMHWAYLYNYLGFREIAGSELQRIGRGQVEHFGGTLISATVRSVRAVEDGFELTTEDGEVDRARYLILSEGKKPVLAQTLGLHPGADGLDVSRAGRTAIDGVYAIGRMVRPGRSQAIISAGDGAAAAIDIIARLQDQPLFSDWDSPPKAG